jgi:hypothetical protein
MFLVFSLLQLLLNFNLFACSGRGGMALAQDVQRVVMYELTFADTFTPSEGLQSLLRTDLSTSLPVSPSRVLLATPDTTASPYVASVGFLPPSYGTGGPNEPDIGTVVDALVAQAADSNSAFAQTPTGSQVNHGINVSQASEESFIWCSDSKGFQECDSGLCNFKDVCKQDVPSNTEAPDATAAPFVQTPAFCSLLVALVTMVSATWFWTNRHRNISRHRQKIQQTIQSDRAVGAEKWRKNHHNPEAALDLVVTPIK